MLDLIFCLMGPTASGKTGLACELVQQFPFEIVSVDSAMIYRGMNIGTAKPSTEELQKAPHHLIDLIDPNQHYSAAQFCSDVRLLCKEIVQRQHIPLLVGGTMMYFNALQKGLAELPEADATIRLQLEEEAAQKGWEVLYQRLQCVDSESASRIHVHDTQRIQRALEVHAVTGLPLSTFLNRQPQEKAFRFINIGLYPEPRAWLHERIASRFGQMLTEGLVEEVTHLKTVWNLQDTMPSMRCVGYRQVLEYLQGKEQYASMQEKGIAATRQLAKRQLTWLRHWEEVLFFNPLNTTFHAEVVAKIQELLDNEGF